MIGKFIGAVVKFVVIYFIVYWIAIVFFGGAAFMGCYAILREIREWDPTAETTTPASPPLPVTSSRPQKSAGTKK